MQKKRYDYLDNLKWVLVIVVIIHHCLGAAGPEPMFGLLRVGETYEWQYGILGSFLGFNQSFFMALFFFISALFVVSSYGRKGARTFALGRIKRLGIPILFTYFVVNAFQDIIKFWGEKTVLDAYFEYVFSNFHFSEPLLNVWFLGVTWFNWALLVFTLLWLLSAKTFAARGLAVSKQPIPALWKMAVFAVVIIPVNYSALAAMSNVGENFLGFRLLKYFPMYIAMFYFGVQAYRHQWLDQLELKHAAAGILMWVFGIGYVANFVNGYGHNGEMAGRGFTVIGMSLFLLFVFRELFNRRTQFTAVLSRSAFAAYVFQLMFISLFAKLYQPFMTEIPLVNFIAIAIPSVIGSFGFGHLVVRTPGLRKIF